MPSAAAATTARPLPLNPLALRLAYAGLIPFVIGALLIWLLAGYNADAHAFVALALTSYAAVVISLLGGIHWGLGMRQSIPSPQPFVWGVTATLLAWVAVVMPANAGLALHGLVLVICYLVDRRSYPALGAGAWLTLRFRLSALSALCCFLGAAGS